MSTITSIEPNNSDNGWVCHLVNDCAGDIYIGSNAIGLYIGGLDTYPDHYPMTMFRSYIEWDTSAIPAGATIEKVEMGSTMYQASPNGLAIAFLAMAGRLSSYSTNQDLFNAIASGTYLTSYLLDPAEYNFIYDLGANAVSALSSHKTWFGLGMMSDEDTIYWNSYNDLQIMYSTHGGNDTLGKHPFLKVTYKVGGRTRVMYFD